MNILRAATGSRLLFWVCSISGFACRAENSPAPEDYSSLPIDSSTLVASAETVAESAAKPTTITQKKTPAKASIPSPEASPLPKAQSDDQLYIDRQALNIDFLPDRLSYIYWDETKQQPLDYQPKLSQHAKIKRVIEYGENDRPPVFTAKCRDKTDMQQCSRQAVQAFVEQHFDPTAIQQAGSPAGVQYVTFIIDKNGQIIPDIRVVRPEKQACPACAREAVRVVQSMPNWQPAILAGQAVSVRAVLPVRYQPAAQ